MEIEVGQNFAWEYDTRLQCRVVEVKGDIIVTKSKNGSLTEHTKQDFLINYRRYGA